MQLIFSQTPPLGEQEKKHPTDLAIGILKFSLTDIMSATPVGISEVFLKIHPEIHKRVIPLLEICLKAKKFLKNRSQILILDFFLTWKKLMDQNPPDIRL